MQRRWCNSLLFWLGTLPLAFLLWSWVDSASCDRSASCGSNTLHVGVGHTNQYVTFTRTDNPHGLLPLKGFQSSVSPRDPFLPNGFDLVTWTVPQILGHARFDAVRFQIRAVFVAHWVMVAVYLILWLSTLIAWRRRGMWIANRTPPGD